jgi:hypothetical protein
VAIKNPRTLVVDADIAQATGGKDAIHPIPVRCREFAADWFLEMTASGKIVRVKGQTRDDDLREAIFEAIHENARNVVAKDLHLVEAAKLAHEIVASKDNRTRNHLKIAAIHVEAIKTIIWVNPKPPEADNEKDEMCIIWLREGALYEEERSLAYKKP